MKNILYGGNGLGQNSFYLLILVNFLSPGSGSALPIWFPIQESHINADLSGFGSRTQHCTNIYHPWPSHEHPLVLAQIVFHLIPPHSIRLQALLRYLPRKLAARLQVQTFRTVRSRSVFQCCWSRLQGKSERRPRLSCQKFKEKLDKFSS